MKRTDLPAIGSPLEGGFYTDVIFIDGKAHAIITADKAFEIRGEWLEDDGDAKKERHIADSLKNTDEMAAEGSEIAKQVRAMTAGGFNDWALPARDAQERQYFRFKPTDDENACSWRDGENPSTVPPAPLYTEESPAQTTIEAFKAGGPQAFEPKTYWSSTRASSYGAVVQDFDDGCQGYDYMQFELLVRPVRQVPLDD